MRGRSVVAVLCVAVVCVVTACSNHPVPSPQPSTPTTAAGPAPPPTGATHAVSRCHPASPITLWHSFLPQVEGTGHGATLWDLLMFAHPLPARVFDQEKIVWRMTGTGPLTLTAIDPYGTHHHPTWGPSAHLGSDWHRPGEEWGAGYLFTEPGCWDLRAVRGKATADVWLQVVAR